MSELYLAELTAWVPGAGAAPFLHWVTVGDAGWSLDFTPVRSPAKSVVAGIPLDGVTDDSAVNNEGFYRTVSFTGNADKIVSCLVKRDTAIATQRFSVADVTAAVRRLHITIDFTAAVPVCTIAEGAGIILGVIPEGTGYRIIGKAVGVVAANTNWIQCYPTNSGAGLGTYDIGDIQAWNSDVYVGPTILRYATGQGLVTQPTETPANTYYDPRIWQPADVKRDLFDSGTLQGRGRMAFGDLVLLNPDGALDPLLTYGFSGREVIIRRGDSASAYPGGFQTVLVGTMEQPEVQGQRMVIKIRDAQLRTDQPLQATKYLGDNALPAGLEGVEDLKGKPKPVCLGSVKNVPAVCVNTAKLIYQVHAGTIEPYPVVYDSGITLGAGRYWALQTDPFGTANIYAVTFGNSLYVAAGAAGALATSPTGTTWTSRTSQFGANDIAGLAYGAGVYVAVGGAGTLASSPDGTTWTLRTSTFGAALINGVAYDAGIGLFIAVGVAGAIASSPDGTTWTARTSGFGSDDVHAVASGLRRFVIVGGAGKIASSPDGITWTLRTATFAAAAFNAVAFSPTVGLFVAGGADAGGGSGLSATSQDGITWLQSDSIFSGQIILGLTFGAEYLAVGGGGYLATSADGLRWIVQAATTVFGASAIQAAVYNGAGQYVAVSQGGKIGLTLSLQYNNTTDLLDDTLAPMAGTVISCLSAGYFRLGSPPVGQVTADVTQGAAAGDRTAAQLFKAALVRGELPDLLNTGDLTTLDAANNDVCGYWTDQEVTVAEVLDLIAGSVGASWGADLLGIYRIRQLLAPTSGSVLTITANDLKAPLARVPVRDETKGLPVWRTILRYGRNYTVQTGTALAGGVSDAQRALLGKELYEVTAETAEVRSAHRLAPQSTREVLIQSSADAVAEATRLQTLHGVLRHRYEVVLALTDETDALDLNDVVTLQHARYGLSAGVLMRIIGTAPNAAQRSLTLTLWG